MLATKSQTTRLWCFTVCHWKTSSWSQSLQRGCKLTKTEAVWMERSSIDSIFTKKETQGISFGGFSASSGSVLSHLAHSNQLNLGVAGVSAFLKSSQERQMLLVNGPPQRASPWDTDKGTWLHFRITCGDWITTCARPHLRHSKCVWGGAGHWQHSQGEVQAPPPERIPSGQILPSTPINQASASFQVFMLSGCWDQRVCRKWMWLPRGELMEEVNLDEESTGSVLYGAKFDQYCTVSDLT